MKKFVNFPGVFNLFSYNPGSQLAFTDRVIQRFDLATPLRDRTSFVQAHIELNEEEKKKKTRRVPNVTRIFKSDGSTVVVFTFFFFFRSLCLRRLFQLSSTTASHSSHLLFYSNLFLSLCSLALEICVRLRTTTE